MIVEDPKKGIIEYNIIPHSFTYPLKKCKHLLGNKERENILCILKKCRY